MRRSFAQFYGVFRVRTFRPILHDFGLCCNFVVKPDGTRRRGKSLSAFVCLISYCYGNLCNARWPALIHAFVDMSQKLIFSSDLYFRCYSISSKRTALARFNTSVNSHFVKPSQFWILFYKLRFLFYPINATESSKTSFLTLQRDTFKHPIF